MSIRLQRNDTDFMCVDLGEEGKLKGRGGERGRQEVLKRKHSPVVSSILKKNNNNTETFAPSEQRAAEEAGLFLRLRDLDAVAASLSRVALQFCVHL